MVWPVIRTWWVSLRRRVAVAGLPAVRECTTVDAPCQNARRNSDPQNARNEHDKALKRVITAMFKDDTQLFKLFQDNSTFRRWLTDTIFAMTYEA
jgi:hypothetical protein